MEWINRKILAIAIVLSIITSGFIFAYINNITKSPSAGEKVRVYVALKIIPERSIINITDIKSIEIEKKNVQNGSLNRKEDIIGKWVKETIYEGEQIRKDRIVDEKKVNLAYNIPKGKRAISININEASGVSYNIVPGDYVDVAATFDKDEGRESYGKVLYNRVTKIILQNVQVIATGENSISDSKEAKKSIPKTITLAVDIKADSARFASAHLPSLHKR
ncbi:MAG: Flp pilus assembly protein CpaB [Deltaproteobacteria bacterium]